MVRSPHAFSPSGIEGPISRIKDSLVCFNGVFLLHLIGPDKQIGIDLAVNSMKGKFFNAGLPDIPRIQTPASNPKDWIDKNLNLWNDMGMAMAFLDVPVVANLFKIVNTGVYEALLAFNVIQSCEAPAETTDWAATYKSWLPVFLSSQQALIQNHASALTAVITNNPAATLDANDKPNLYAKAFKNLEATYNPAKMTFDQGALLTWPVTATANIQKRAAASQCVITSASATLTAEPSCLAGGAPWYSPTRYAMKYDFYLLANTSYIVFVNVALLPPTQPCLPQAIRRVQIVPILYFQRRKSRQSRRLLRPRIFRVKEVCQVARLCSILTAKPV